MRVLFLLFSCLAVAFFLIVNVVMVDRSHKHTSRNISCGGRRRIASSFGRRSGIVRTMVALASRQRRGFAFEASIFPDRLPAAH